MAERERSLPLRAGHPLKKALKNRGLVARLVVAREDGKPLTRDDAKEIDATVHAFEGMDKAAYAALAKGAPKPAKVSTTRSPGKPPEKPRSRLRAAPARSK